MAKLRVLVVDDSAYNRQTLTEILTSHPEIEVIGRAYDGEEALKLAAQLQPDLITLDIEMPKMDGFTFLRLLMAKMPTPVIVISSHSRKQEVFQALELGALDFIAKPSHHIAPDLASLRDELLQKAMTVRSLRPLAVKQRAARTEPSGARSTAEVRKTAPKSTAIDRLVVIGASTGGPPALETLCRALPGLESAACVVGQHMPAKFTKAFAERLNRVARVEIVEAEDGMRVAPGHVYIAPGGRHTELGKLGPGELLLRISDSTEADRYVPSIDRLFESASRAMSAQLLSVVLTGMGSDGALGVRAVKAAGGHVLAESEETAIVYGMPKEAAATGCVHEQLGLPGLIERVVGFVEGRAVRG